MNYLLKRIKNLFTKQRLLSLLLVLNIVVSCLVICFSYGLYQNYNIIIDEGEAEEIEEISVAIYDEYYSTDPDKPLTTEVTAGMVRDFIYMLDENTMAVIKDISVVAGFTTDIYKVQGTDEYGAILSSFHLNRENGMIIATDFYNEMEYITPEEYDSGAKKAVLGIDLFMNSSIGIGYGFGNAAGGSNYSLETPSEVLPMDIQTVKINGEDYKVAGIGNCMAETRISFNCLPDDAKVSTSLSIKFLENTHITKAIYEDIQVCAAATMSPYTYVPEIELPETTETYYYKTIMFISVFIALLAAINMAILYRYILEKRSSELAILRICGCSKVRAILSYLTECMIINAPLFAITELCYHKLIMPRLTGLFPNMEGAYSPKLYAIVFCIYFSASLIIMLIMIASVIHRHSLVTLKNATKAKDRLNVMKIFEIIQLSAVLAIMTCLVSAILSRYTYYQPLENILTSEGYMIQQKGSTTSYEELEEACLGSRIVYSVYDAVPLSQESSITSINCCDELYEIYQPIMKDGTWLDDTDITYEKDGIIPAVITDGSGYSVGDIIHAEANYYDKVDYNKIVFVDKYDIEIVGVIKDDQKILGYTKNRNSISDFRDLYSVYDYDYYEEPFIFVRNSDTALHNMELMEYTETVHGYLSISPNFVITEGLTAEERDTVKNNLLMLQMSIMPLSELNKNSLDYIYRQMYTLFPIAVCIFILTVISTVSISAIYTKRQLRNYAILYICGARWRSCALRSLRSAVFTCLVSSGIAAAVLIIGKLTFLKETVISFGIWHLLICLGVIVLYLLLAMIMPLSIIGSSQPREVVKEE